MNSYLSYAHMPDGETIVLEARAAEISDAASGKVSEVTIRKKDIPHGAEYIDMLPDLGESHIGDRGYFISPRGGPYVKNSYMLTSFGERADIEHIISDPAIPIFGVRRDDLCFVAIVVGMRCNYDTVIGVRGGRYYIYPRFRLDGEEAPEDIRILYVFLNAENADYSDMAKVYRSYQLSHGVIKPLKERVKDNPCLAYATSSMNVRIRLGMKPIPTPVMEQTEENEPKMVVSCDFDRLRRLIDEFYRQGIRKAEFCLIGWNLRGHDGRYPQMFPVEPSLGGEEKLQKVIAYAQSLGYQMTCHSNSSDAYSISSMWNPEDILKLKNGELSVDPNPWSGGRMYQLCPCVAKEQAREILPKIADLGFRGIHYIDVISLHPPRKCYSEKHPITRAQAAAVNDDIMKECHELFGGFSSEGGYDTNIGNLDFALVVHSNTMGEQTPLCDRVIPLWELVYHGTVLHNTSWESGSFNAIPEEVGLAENEKKLLKNIEFGGRALVYFHHMFHGHSNETGLGYSTDDDKMSDSVRRAKRLYDEYEKLSYLQYEFMEKHEMVRSGVFRTTYSDNTVITVDYNTLSYNIEKP